MGMRFGGWEAESGAWIRACMGAGCVALSMMALMASARDEKIMLWPEGKIPSAQSHQHVPYLMWHNPSALRTKAILIAVSGGGYNGNVVEGFEVSPMRDYMLDRGMTVVTMLYRTPRPNGIAKHVTAWQDAQRTVRIVRSEALKRGLDPDNIGFTGCSAGGHLTLMAATSSRTSAYPAVDEIDRLPCNVNWAIAVYPAYLLSDGFDRHNSKNGNDLSDRLAPELAFDSDTPPICLFHGDADWWSAMGSVRVYHRIRTMGLPAELHVMALEQHCFMTNPRAGTPAESWKDAAWRWLVSMDFVTGHPQTWRSDWKCVFAAGGPALETWAEFSSGAWALTDWCNTVLMARENGALWLRESYCDCEIDLEVKVESRNAFLLLSGRGDDLMSVTRVPLSCENRKDGVWNRFTVRCENGLITSVVNGCQKDDKVTCDVSNGVRIGLEGKGSAFRNFHIRRTSGWADFIRDGSSVDKGVK